jgi:hypothetical protein
MANAQLVSREDEQTEHRVEFYEGAHFICDAVADFFADGFKTGQPMVLVSTPEHRNGIFESLSSLGLDGNNALAAGQLMWLDARETLATFMIDGMPDERLFRTSVGGALEHSRAGREHLTIRAFGEMVDLLLVDGNPEAALRLEELWNDLGKLYGFSLLCAYSIGNLIREEHWRYFHKICDEHMHVRQSDIDAVTKGREFAMASPHIAPSNVRDFAFGKALFSPAQLSHFSDCDVCSELWWRLRQAAKPHLAKNREGR